RIQAFALIPVTSLFRISKENKSCIRPGTQSCRLYARTLIIIIKVLTITRCAGHVVIYLNSIIRITNPWISAIIEVGKCSHFHHRILLDTILHVLTMRASEEVYAKQWKIRAIACWLACSVEGILIIKYT